MLESRVEEYLKRRTEKSGGLYLKFTSPGNVGVPDRIIVRNGAVTFVELKQEHGRLSPIQKAQIARLRRAGADVRVAYGRQGAERLADELFGAEGPEPPTGGAFGIEEWR